MALQPFAAAQVALKPSSAQQPLPAAVQAAAGASSEWARFQEGLRLAKPAPMGNSSGATNKAIPSTHLVRFEAATGKTTSFARAGIERDTAGLQVERPGRWKRS